MVATTAGWQLQASEMPGVHAPQLEGVMGVNSLTRDEIWPSADAAWVPSSVQ